MEIRTVKHPKTSYSQCQQSAARVLLIVWLLASCSPEVTLATPERQGVMVPATTTSPDTPSLASALPTPPPGGHLAVAPDSLGSLWSSSTLPTLPPGGQLPPDSPRSLWSSGVASSPAIERVLQQRMRQEAAPNKGHDLLRISPKVSPVSENLSFQAREGESVRFHYQKGQWRAEVSSHIGDFSRRAVLPVVCSQGEDVASNLEVLSRYPGWQSQRQIHVLGKNAVPTLGEVVYLGELGLKGRLQGAGWKGRNVSENMTIQPSRIWPESVKHKVIFSG